MLLNRTTLPRTPAPHKGDADWLVERIGEFQDLLCQSKAKIKPLGETSEFIVPENYMNSECRESIRMLTKRFNQNIAEFAMWVLATLAYKSLGCRRKQAAHGDAFEQTWFPMSSEIWKKGCHRYEHVIQLLVMHGFLEQDGVPVKGVTCMKYRLGKACFKEYVRNPNFYEQTQEWAKTLDENGNSCVSAPQMFLRNKNFKGEKNFVRVKFSHPKIIERINASRKKAEELPETHRIQEAFLNGSDSRGRKYVTLSADILEDAKREYQEDLRAIEKMRKKSKKADHLDKANHKLWQAEYLYEEINGGESYYVVDGTSQRAHHPCTILPNRFMKHLRICGEKVAESDFRNSQPAIFAYVMDRILSGDKEFIVEIENLMMKAACVGKTRPVIGEEIRKFRRNHLLKRYKDHESLRDAIRTTVSNFVVFLHANEGSVRKYISDCYAGKTYENVQVELDKIGSREKAKHVTFKNMFGHSSECSLAQLAAKLAYPQAMQAIDSLKDIDYGITAKIAQAIESKEMFEKILPEIQKHNPFVITRHDSVITLPSRIQACRDQMDKAFRCKLQTKLTNYHNSDGYSAEQWAVEREAEHQRVAERDHQATRQPALLPAIYVAENWNNETNEGSQVAPRALGVTKHRLSHWLIP